MKSANKSAMTMRLITLALCAVVLTASGVSQNQSGALKRELPAPTGKLLWDGRAFTG